MYSYYSYKKKKPYGIIITVLISSIIIGVTGFIIYKNLTAPLNNATPKAENAGENPVSGEISPSPTIYTADTSFTLTKSYICGHEYKTNEKIPENFIGKTIEEIFSMQYDYEITDYSSHSITATKYINDECDSHYIIKLKGKTLMAYNKKNPQEIIKKTDINLFEYYEEDIRILNNGIEVTSMNELLEFFEDFA